MNDLHGLRQRLRGELIEPTSPGYDDARRIFNAMIDKRPAMIARCAGVNDVLESVRFARERGLLVAVRGGGHNVAGKAVCDGGIVIDLRGMKGVRVDPARRTARAEAGLTWGELDRETQAFRLVAPGGVVSTTGISGLTLGGGLGWLMRKHGLSCDNLLSADVVTADGRFLTASATENADLFWGLRGGGGNFGVVTSFEYRLHPVDGVLGGMMVHPAAKAKEVLRFCRDFGSQAPDELNVSAGMMYSPDGQPIVVLVVTFVGNLDAGEEIIRPLRQFGSPLVDEVRRRSYRELQTQLDAGFPFGLQNYWKSNFLATLSDDAIDTLIAHFAGVTSPLSAWFIEHLGGAVSRASPAETAFNLRDGLYNLLIISRWTDPSEADKHIPWAKQLSDAMRPFSTDAIYVNYMAHDETPERLQASYGAATYQRLAALKQKYDPTNFFRMNQNIRPG